MINDLDGGPDFWPTASDGENTVYRLLRPVNLLDSWSNGGFHEKKFEKTDKRDDFMKMMQQLKEDDNPIIMAVRLFQKTND